MADETQKLLRDAKAALERIQRGLSPTKEELAEAPLLDPWTVATDGQSVALTGVVTGHPRLRDGATILTSNLLWMRPDRKAARTVSRFYRLGQMMDESEGLQMMLFTFNRH